MDKTKICSKCKKEKHIIDFSKDSSKSDGLYSSCKDCKRIKDMNYRDNNRDKYRKYQKKWQKNNPEKTREYQKRYYKKNKDKRIKNSTNWIKKERRENPAFRIRCNLGSRLSQFVTGKRRVDSIKDIIGITFNELREYLEEKFDNKMTWDNYGDYWEIDHIKPCASFDLTDKEQQKECFHYTNLQPLTGKENRIKQDKEVLLSQY